MPSALEQQVLDSVGETPEWLPYDRWKMYLPGDKLFDVGTETPKGLGFRGYRGCFRKGARSLTVGLHMCNMCMQYYTYNCMY